MESAAESATLSPRNTKYIPPEAPAKPDDYQDFLLSLTKEEQNLLEFAQEKLGSSFIVQWCNMYKNWKNKKTNIRPTNI